MDNQRDQLHIVCAWDVSADWSIDSVGDYNGDGIADILWRNAGSGDVTAWYGSADNAEPNLLYAPQNFSFTAKDLGVVSADWRIATK